MTIRHLRIFTAVCRSGSVTAAAQQLYMTQPAVSLAIKELEEYYGVRLFDRLARRLRITGDGKRMLEYSLNIIRLFDDMEQAMRNPDYTGELHIGSSLTIAACLLPDYVNRLGELMPGIKPRVAVDNSESIIELVSQGKLDVGLVESSVADEALTAEPFMTDELVAVCGCKSELPSDRIVPLDEFLSHPLLEREVGSGVRELVDSLLSLWGKAIIPAWESASTTALLRAVEAGNGVSFLPEKLVEESLMSGKLRRLTLDVPEVKRSFYMIRHRKKYLSAGVRCFMDIVHAGANSERMFK